MNRTTKGTYNRRLTDEYDSIPKAIEMPPDDEEYDLNYEPTISDKKGEGNSNEAKGDTMSNSGGEKRVLNKVNPVSISNSSIGRGKVNIPNKSSTIGKGIGSNSNTVVNQEQKNKQLVEEGKEGRENNQNPNPNIIISNPIIINTNNNESNINNPYTHLNSKTKSAFDSFPVPASLDKFSNDRVRDTYTKLHNYTKELVGEKELILESLRTETLNNEEQRNYIELLRQTIESSILKNGLSAFLQSLRGAYNPNSNYNFKDLSNVDILMEISKIKNEADKHRKELIMAQVLISELKQENDELKKANEDANLKQETIRENMETGANELEVVKTQIRNLEQEKEDVLLNYEEAKVDNKKLMEDLDETKSLVRKYEREIQEQTRKISDFKMQLENHLSVQSSLNEYKKSFEKLYQDFEILLKEKSNAELDIEQLRDVLNEREDEINRLKNVIDEKDDKYENDKRNWFNENETLNRNNKKLERLVNELSNTIKDRENTLHKLEDKFADTQEMLNKTKSLLDESKLDNEELKKTIEKNNINHDKSLRELNSLNKELKISIENIENEKLNIYNDFLNMKAECEKLDSELQRVNGEVNSKERSINKLNLQYENLFKEFKTTEDERNSYKKENEIMNKELRYWKEKYDKDINNKISEINILNKEISNKTRSIEELNKNINDLEDELASKDEIISNYDNEVIMAKADISCLQANKDDLLRKIEKFEAEIQKEKKSNYELSSRGQNISIKYEETNKSLRLVEEDRDRLEMHKNKLLEELDTIKKIEKENKLKNESLSTRMKEIKQEIVNCHGLILNNFANKLSDLITETKSLNIEAFSRNFEENVRKLQSDKSVNTVDVLRVVEDWITTVFSEVDNLVEHIKKNNDASDYYKEKTDALEERLKQAKRSEDERINKERQMKADLQDLSEDNKALRTDLDEIKGRYERLANDLRAQKEDSRKLLEETNSWKDDVNRLNEINQNLKEELKIKDQKFNNATFQVDALEERMVIISREKQYLESLLLRVSKSHPEGELHRIVNEILNITDSLSQLERDKIKLEDNLIQIEEKKSINKGNDREREKMKNNLYEYERKISELNQLVNNLEGKIGQIEFDGKKLKNSLYETEMRVKSLERELVDAREELKRFRSLNLNIKSDRYTEEDFSYIEGSKLRTNAGQSTLRSNKSKMNRESLDFNYDNEGERVDTNGSNLYKFSPNRLIDSQSQSQSFVVQEERRPTQSSLSTSKDLIYRRQVRNKSFNNSNPSVYENY